jgi:hypothetical protein
VATSGVSQIIDPNGQVHARLAALEQGAISGLLKRETKLTFFTRFGWLTPWCVLAMTAVCCAPMAPGGITNRLFGDWISRAIVQSCRTKRTRQMNVTMKLPDEIVRKARIRAVHNSQSLSAWMADLVFRELAMPSDETEASMTLAEAMRVPGMPDSFYEKDFPLPDRKTTKHREFTFEPDEG